MEVKKRVALMTYAIDNRSAKGTAIYARHLVERLLKDPAYTYVLVHYESCDDPIYHMGAQEIVMPHVPGFLPAKHFLRFLLFCWKYRKERFDIVHWFQPRLYPLYWLVPARRIIVTMHGAGAKTSSGSPGFSVSVFNFVLTYCNRWVDACIVVSKHAREEVAKHYRMSSEKIYVTYNGVDARFKPPVQGKKELQEELREKYKIPSPYILDVSRFDPHKNIVTLVAAYAALVREKSVTETLVFVGGRHLPDYSNLVDEKIKKTGLRDRVFIAPFISDEDMPKVYAGAELFVFPSLDEGFGMPVVEAMAVGTPVVTSDTSCLPEIAGGAALLVDPHSTDAIADGVYRVLSDEKLRDVLVQKGLARAKDFSWETMAEQTLEIYKRVLAAPVL